MPFQLNTIHVMLRCAMGWLVSHYPTIRRSPQPGSANPQTTPLSLFTDEPCRHARRCCLTPTRVCGAQHDAMHRRCRLYAGVSALILASRSARNDSAPSTVSCGSIGYLCTPGVLMLLTRWRLRQL
jgi:hypothetical protein